MDKIFKHEKIIITLVLFITIFFALQIPDINIDNDLEVFLPDDHISKVTNDEIKDIFGTTDSMVVALNFRKQSLFSQKNLVIIDNMTADLEEISGINEVTSFTNAEFIEGTAEGMVVEDLMGEIPQSQQQLYQLKSRLLSWDFYRNNLYSDDFKSTQLLISLDENLTPDDKDEVYQKLKSVSENYQDFGLETYIAGAAAINVLMGDKMIQDVQYLIPLVFIVLLLILYYFFRKIKAVILTLITVAISSIWAIGLMAYLEINMTLVSTVIPVLLLAVGSAYGIHILSHYYDDLSEEKDEVSEARQREIVLNTISKMGKPVFLAALTTVAGFASLATSEIIPIRDFGIFTAIGIITAFLVALFLIPSLLLITYKGNDQVDKEKQNSLNSIGTVIKKMHKFYSNKRVSIVITILIIIIASITGMTKIVIDTPLIEMFKEDTEIRQSDNFINQNFAGTSIMNVMIEGEERGSLNDPEILLAVDNLQHYLMDNLDNVGKASSITDFIKRMNQVMHYPEEEIEEESNEESAEVADGASFYNGGTDTDNDSEEVFEEDTGSFYDSSENEEDTGSFYQANEEDSGSFYDSDDSFNEGEEESHSEREILSGPDQQQNLSEYDFILLLNQALARAEHLNLSAEELVELLNEELNYQATSYYEIPYDLDRYGAASRENLKNLISQYLLLYSGSVDDLINDQLEPDKAQMMVQIKNPSNLAAAEVKDEIVSYTDRYFPERYQVTISGNADMALAANNLIVSSQQRSILASFVIVFLIVAFSFKSILAGIYGIIPLAFSLVINFGLMGHLGIKLDVGTAMVASIAIGIGVDYTIHILNSYHRERLKTDDLFEVTQNSLLSTGKAVIFNAVSVALGFVVLLFSNFYPLVYLGFLIAVTMFTSSAAALTILPLLLNVFKPSFISKKL